MAGFVIAVALAIGGLGSLLEAPPATAAGLSRWTGGVDLYRSGVFTTQQTWLWCTAADVQIMRNVVQQQRDHSRASQQRYFDYMRRHNRYAIPVADGVDPAGWAAGLRHFVDSRYKLVTSGSFKAAVRSAVRNLRLTGLPVGITVSHGNHAWVLTGFTATADPAVTSHFTVTSVNVVGPLWGLQSRSYGYDMRPDTRLARRQLQGFFTPWHYSGVRMAWEGDWVSVQPQVPDTTPSPIAASPTVAPSPAVGPSPSPPDSTATQATPAIAASPAASLDPGALALSAGASGAAQPSSSPHAPPANARDRPSPNVAAGLALLIALLVASGGVAIRAGRRRGHTNPS